MTARALMQPSRRGFLRGAAALLAAPAIVRVASLMPVHAAAVQLAPSAGYSTIVQELAAITRRAFIPRVVTQIYYATPLLQAMIKEAKPGDDLWLSEGAAA